MSQSTSPPELPPKRWRLVNTISGFEDYVGYRVSNYGDLEGNRYRDGNKDKIRPNWVHGAEWFPMKPNHFGKYLYARLRKAGAKQQRVIQLHRLVLLAFGPLPPTPQAFALHYDDNPLNNVITNLRWGTQKDNAADAVRNQVYPSGITEPNSRPPKCRISAGARQLGSDTRLSGRNTG